MSRTLNKVMLIGNVGKIPELKHTPSGIPVAHFKLATSETWREKDGLVCEHTDWHNIVAWRGLAEVVMKILNKGTRVYVEGKIRTRRYEDKNNNQRMFVEILADNILLLDLKKNNKHDWNRKNDSDSPDNDNNFGYDIDNDDYDMEVDDCFEKDSTEQDNLY
ncbi:MAG: single-stranded DNA-binding protein [Candidatus Kapaibacterium sp.]